MGVVHRLCSPYTGEKAVYKAAYFVDRQHIVRATLRRYKGKVPKKPPFEIMLSVTRPNFEERKIWKKVGGPHPFFWSWSK
jgi:hypothetical protein